MTKKDAFVGQVVVIDTPAKWVYIGTVTLEDDNEVVLEDVDAFDASETTLTKQEYLLKVRQDGVVPNRRVMKISKGQVVGMTRLEDVLAT